MSPQGRPRLTEDDLRARIKAYCKSYGAPLNDQGFPTFPAGKRETPQHREWVSLYKLWNRLGRRSRGQCERCTKPISEGSVHCEEHRAATAGPAGQHRASLEDRGRLLAAQKAVCPVCAEKVDLLESVEDRRADGLALLHASCHRLASLAAAAGASSLDRLRAYLWPRPSKSRS